MLEYVHFGGNLWPFFVIALSGDDNTPSFSSMLKRRQSISQNTKSQLSATFTRQIATVVMETAQLVVSRFKNI